MAKIIMMYKWHRTALTLALLSILNFSRLQASYSKENCCKYRELKTGFLNVDDIEFDVWDVPLKNKKNQNLSRNTQTEIFIVDDNKTYIEIREKKPISCYKKILHRVTKCIKHYVAQ